MDVIFYPHDVQPETGQATLNHWTGNLSHFYRVYPQISYEFEFNLPYIVISACRQPPPDNHLHFTA